VSKTKNKERSESEYLRGQIRKLESENRQLKRRVKALDRRAHFYEDLVEDATEDINIKDRCPSCKEGTTSIVDLKYVRFETCDSCDYRKKL
jgi:ribosomal protein L44E